jgi:hypothetical protein
LDIGSLHVARVRSPPVLDINVILHLVVVTKVGHHRPGVPKTRILEASLQVPAPLVDKVVLVGALVREAVNCFGGARIAIHCPVVAVIVRAPRIPEVDHPFQSVLQAKSGLAANIPIHRLLRAHGTIQSLRSPARFVCFPTS